MLKTLSRLLILLIFIPMAWLLVLRLEGGKPEIQLDLPSVYLNKDHHVSVSVEDAKSGLRRIVVSIVQAGSETVLLEKEYDTAAFFSLLSGPETVTDAFDIPVDLLKHGIKDGEAVIRVTASDLSWRGWNKGNVTHKEQAVIIDSVPPQVTVLTTRHNIEQGGAGLVIYQVSEDDIRSGVQVGDNFFPGHPGLFDNRQIHAAFFALDYTQGSGTRLAVVAEDQAGNSTRKGFYHYIRDKVFQKDTLNISKGFLESKIPDFDIGDENQRFQAADDPLLEKFLYINRTVRKNNVDRLLGVSSATENKMHWSGRFLRMEGAAKRAGFADHRTYLSGGREIDRAVHLGIDLASTAHAPIAAANTGRVIFAQFEGIFGNSVVIDHGFGLCSLYSHLSQIRASTGDMVQKGDVIGLSGLTGLAGGDHLHFSMIVHNVFVNPVEWWDDTWIDNNITSKIDTIRQLPNH